MKTDDEECPPAGGDSKSDPRDISKPGNLIEKWEKTGLLKNINTGKGLLAMAQLLEREARYVLAEGPGSLMAWVPDPNERRWHVNMLFPMIRRVYGAIDYQVSSERIEAFDLGISFSREMLQDLVSYNGIDAEVELCQILSCQAIKALKGFNPVLVGSVPLGIRMSNHRAYLFAQVMKR